MDWGSGFPGRRLWRVRSIDLDQPMVVGDDAGAVPT